MIKWQRTVDGNYLDGVRFVIYPDTSKRGNYLLQDFVTRSYPGYGKLPALQKMAAKIIGNQKVLPYIFE